jgi:hypothetical protein
MNGFRDEFPLANDLCQMLDGESVPLPIKLTECVRRLGLKDGGLEILIVKICSSRG